MTPSKLWIVDMGMNWTDWPRQGVSEFWLSDLAGKLKGGVIGRD